MRPVANDFINLVAEQFQVVLYRHVVAFNLPVRAGFLQDDNISFETDEFWWVPFRNNTFVEHYNLVGVRTVLAGAPPRSRYGLSGKIQDFQDDAFVVRIRGCSSLHQRKGCRGSGYTAGRDQDPLFGPHADAIAFRTDPGIELKRQLVDEFLQVGHRNGQVEPLHVDRFIPHGDVTGNAVGENKTLLHHNAAMAAPCALIDVERLVSLRS